MQFRNSIIVRTVIRAVSKQVHSRLMLFSIERSVCLKGFYRHKSMFKLQNSHVVAQMRQLVRKKITVRPDSFEFKSFEYSLFRKIKCIQCCALNHPDSKANIGFQLSRFIFPSKIIYKLHIRHRFFSTIPSANSSVGQYTVEIILKH